MIERYSTDQMQKIWTLENKYKIWLQIEILAAEAGNKLGYIPDKALTDIKKKAKFSVERSLEIEKEVRHDVVAFLTDVAENVGESSKYVHYGLTSSDVVDTALCVQLKQAIDLIVKSTENLAKLLKKKAKEYKTTIIMGRTHGVHAEPMTLGLKFALWHFEVKRDLERLQKAKDTISYGKISGAVGTYANIDPEVEVYVCEKLGLKPAPVSTQIIQRDRHAEYMAALAILAASLEKFSTEIRHLQRTELKEVEEPFKGGQKGSSAMPHKRNPIISERISGLSRVIRGNLQAALENVALWHERDISHSSVERIILPDSTTLIDYMLTKFTEIIEGLVVYPENMEANLEKSKGMIFSQRVLLALIDKGMSREEAYKLVQKNAMQAFKLDQDFKYLLEKDEKVTKLLSLAELEKIFDYRYYLRQVDKIFKRLG